MIGRDCPQSYSLHLAESSTACEQYFELQRKATPSFTDPRNCFQHAWSASDQQDLKALVEHEDSVAQRVASELCNRVFAV